MSDLGQNFQAENMGLTGAAPAAAERTCLPVQSELFSDYVDSICELVELRHPIAYRDWREKLSLCLNGEPGRILRSRLSRAELRQKGAYFTGPKFAARLATVANSGQNIAQSFYDPACGAGDLLLAVAATLPLEQTLPETISRWGTQLAGSDISADFVRLTKARLALLAAQRSKVRAPLSNLELLDSFPRITVSDYLAPRRIAPQADVFVMNPPFGYTIAPPECDWTSGRVNSAALFIERAIKDACDEARIVAILPDVLRSGSRYVKWRKKTRAMGSVLIEKPLGLFDRWTDVDVYLFHFKKGANSDTSGIAQLSDSSTYGVGKRFSVRVGPVVPHRHPESGPLAPYIDARSLPRWSECTKISKTRRFSGQLLNPPFVCVRRTSRPGEQRAVATLVLGEDAIAIENHLIALLPKDDSVQTCRRLMRCLASPKTDAWLNSRLRCRHLTTRALAEMPWWYKP